MGIFLYRKAFPKQVVMVNGKPQCAMFNERERTGLNNLLD